MKEQNKRKSTILLIIGVLTLLIVVAGATYAYFQAQTGDGQHIDVSAQTGTTDSLTFSMEDKNVTDASNHITDNDSESAITINATMTNFKENAESIADGVTGKVVLKANSTTREANETYNVYLHIDTNELEYSSYKDTDGNVKLAPLSSEEKEAYTEGIPELILTVKKNGTEIKNITSLESYYKEGIEIKYNDESGEQTRTLNGYDITEKGGIIKISTDETGTIAVTAPEDGSQPNPKEDEWEITLTFINLPTDQEINTGKSVSGKVIIQKEEYVPAYEKNITKLLVDSEEDTLIHHNGTIKAPSQLDNTEDTEIIGGYQITPNHQSEYGILYASDSSELSENRLIKFYCNNDEYFIGHYCDPSNPQHYTLAYDTSQTPYTFKQALQKALTDGYAESSIIDANDESYRYSGSSENVHNYVCLDNKTGEDECSNDDLYRIIGLFKNKFNDYEMKLIKADYATEGQLGVDGARNPESNYIKSSESTYKGELEQVPKYYWASSDNDSNLWKGSTLNTYNLNTKFLEYLRTTDGKKEKIVDQITKHEWITAGNNYYKVYYHIIAVDSYKNEIVNPDRGITNASATEVDDKTTAKIGLMYVSDYGYATSSENWQTEIYNYNQDNISTSNWMYMGLYEWTITRRTDNWYDAFRVDSGGRVDNWTVYSIDHCVRPTFYLKSSTEIASGDGTLGNPYRLSW